MSSKNDFFQSRIKIFLVLIIFVIGAFVFFQSEQTSDKNNNKDLASEKSTDQSKDNPVSRVPASKPVAAMAPAPIKFVSLTKSGEFKKYLLEKKSDYQSLYDEKGRLMSLMGPLPVKIQGATDAELAAKEIAESLIDDASGIHSAQKQEESTPRQNSYRFNQEKNGYAIVDAYLDIFVNKATEQPYMVNQNLKQINEFDSLVKYDSCAASGILKNLGYEPSKDCQAADKPKIFVKDSGLAELSWEIPVRKIGETTNAFWKAFVSARTGEILRLNINAHY